MSGAGEPVGDVFLRAGGRVLPIAEYRPVGRARVARRAHGAALLLEVWLPRAHVEELFGAKGGALAPAAGPIFARFRDAPREDWLRLGSVPPPEPDAPAPVLESWWRGQFDDAYEAIYAAFPDACIGRHDQGTISVSGSAGEGGA